MIAGVYISQTSVIYSCLRFGCCLYYRGVRYSEVNVRPELTVMWTAAVQNWNKSFTHIEQRAREVGREGLVQLKPSRHFGIFTSVLVDSSPRSYLFTSATVRISVYTAPKCGTEPIRYVTLHFRDQCGALLCGASLRCRNRAEITVLICEQKHYLVWFSCRRKSHPV